MLIGHFTEQPWQDNTTGLMGTQSLDLSISNGVYDPKVGATLYNRYLDEKIYADQMGFDALMLNEHHSTPFCMQGVTNVGASILARETKKSKIIILGNILPIWDDPLWLAEQLAMIDMISYGRLVSGFVRGGGRESVSHNAPPHFNRERFEEAHDFIIKAWTTPGPDRCSSPIRRSGFRPPSASRRCNGPPDTAIRWCSWPPSWSRPKRRFSSTTTRLPRRATSPAPRTWRTSGRCTSMRPKSWPRPRVENTSRGSA